MGTFHFKKGKDIRLKGSPKKEIGEVLSPKRVAIQPPDFKGLKPRLMVQEGDAVKRGSTIIVDKSIKGLKLLSPLSGKVKAINRGAKRALLEIVIENDNKEKSESFKKFDKLSKIKRKDIIDALLNGGLWPAIRQRPFSKIASPEDKPKAIFIRALNTDPLAPDIDFVLVNQEKDFQNGLTIVSQLTAGKTHLCVKDTATSAALTAAKGVDVHLFSGPHPTGNVSTLIQSVDPINKGDIIWYIEAQDIIRIGQLFTQGIYPNKTTVAVTGEGVSNNQYYRTIVGASIKDLTNNSDLSTQRCISGSVLTGRNVGAEGFVGFYHGQISVIPEGGSREFLGWLKPGADKYTLSNTYMSAFLPETDVSLDTNEKGGHRAIVLNNVYDEYITLDIVTFFLLKAVIAGDIDEAEKLGILECDGEDFALCTFACPSKVDIGAIIEEGLEVIEKEG